MPMSYLEFVRQRLVGLGEVRVGSVEVLYLDDEVVVLRLKFLLESPGLCLELGLQLYDGALQLLNAASAQLRKYR